MKQLIGIGKIAICSIIAIALLSSIVYADEGANTVSIAIANANDGGEAISIVNTGVSIFPDGNGYISSANADVYLETIGESYAYGYAFGEGTSPVDPDGEQAIAGVEIGGYTLAYDGCSSANLLGVATALASTEDLTAYAYANLITHTNGRAEADGFAYAWAEIIE